MSFEGGGETQFNANTWASYADFWEAIRMFCFCTALTTSFHVLMPL